MERNPAAAMMGRVTARTVRLGQNLLLSAAVTAAVVGGLEAACRLLEPHPAAERHRTEAWKPEAPGEHFYTMATDNLGWPPWQEFNRDGLRDRRHTVRKPDDVRRLVFLGDSVTAGIGLAPEEAYPRLLDARFQAAGVPLEVLNVALWGWSTRQERIAYRRIARKYRPDEVVLAVCLNDIQELEHQLSRPPALLVALHERSALVRRVVGAQRREVKDVEELVLGRRGFEHFFSEVRALRDEVSADGARFAVIVFPYRFQVEPKAPPPAAQQKIAALCRDERIPMLDLLPVLAPAGPEAFIDHNHLSADGSRRVADALLAGDLITRPPAYPERLRAKAPAAVRGALASTDVEERRAAAWALGAAGGSEAPTVAALTVALRDVDPGVVREALRALGTIGAPAKDALPAVLGLLDHDREDVRAEAARTAWSLGLDRGQAAALTAHMQSADEYVRHFAVWAAGQLGTAGEEAIPSLLAMLAKEDGHAAGPAAVALRRLVPAHPQIVASLTRALGDAEAAVRVSAARSLGKLGPVAADAAPALLQAASDAREDVRAEVVIALGRVAGASAVPALVSHLRTDSPWVREEAARSLGRLGTAARSAVPDLVEALRAEAPAVRRQAARALGRMGAQGTAAVPALKAALQDADGAVREEAEKAIDALAAS